MGKALAAAPLDNDKFQRALAAHRAGYVKHAERLFKAVLRDKPKHVAALNMLGIVSTQLGKYAEAETYLHRATKLEPVSDATLFNYGLVLKALGRPAEALERFTQALAINSSAAATWNGRGLVLSDLGRSNDAIGDFDHAAGLDPHYAEPRLNKARSLTFVRRFEEALAAVDGALVIKSDLAEAWLVRGDALCALKRYDAGIAAYDRALALEPNWAIAHANRGAALLDIKRYAEALASSDRAVALAPQLVLAHSNRGGALLRLKRHTEALASCDHAIALDPACAYGWLGRGNVLTELKQYDEAAVAYDKALALDPGMAEAWLGRGMIYGDLKRHAAAAAAYDQALVLNPDLSYAAGARLSSKLFLCDWTNLQSDAEKFLTMTRDGIQATDPFVLLAIPSSAADQLRCARRYIQDQPTFAPLWRGKTYRHDRIRIAYLSADFREHPVSRRLARLFERHDKSRFEVMGISFGPDPDSPMRRRLEGAVERFIDVRGETDQHIAELVRRLEVDIAVDLMGLTKDHRLGVFARRAAPIQVNYLGYIGTTGAEYIDYVIADKVALPFEQQPFYTEKIVHLPDCFLGTDDRQEIASRTPSRAEAGLPPNGFVFCSFNNSYKLGRPIFELWMRLLHQVRDSVLWLAESNAEMAVNLRREAQRLGIDEQRIIFAPRLPLAQHLARQRLAGLFLDTVPYNAGATGIDALLSGLPVLTIGGETFVGRMAASMLNAVGLPELVTHDLSEYELLAVKLASEPSVLSAIQLKLRENLQLKPLFNTCRFCRHVEQAYSTMVEILRLGDRPHNFSVRPI